jgi:hypothetical protein
MDPRLRGDDGHSYRGPLLERQEGLSASKTLCVWKAFGKPEKLSDGSPPTRGRRTFRQRRRSIKIVVTPAKAGGHRKTAPSPTLPRSAREGVLSMRALTCLAVAFQRSRRRSFLASAL